MVKEFQGEYRFLSNFWFSPIIIDGIRYDTVEHYYQAMKSISPIYFEQVAGAKNPGTAKRLAREFPVRPDWDEIKVTVMYEGVLNKFSQNTGLKYRLLTTVPMILIEGNTWHDNFWGACSCDKCKDILHQNKLGDILMHLRDKVFIDATLL